MKILSIILILLSGFNGADATDKTTSVIVDRIEENYAVVEVVQNGNIKMIDLPVEDFNIPVTEGTKIAFTEITGKFYTTLDACNLEGREETLYQFKSNDNSVWWLLTAEEIGSIPSFEKEYNLIFYDNGTTAANKTCDCPEEWECECELYDDMFLSIAEVEK